jgi:hypothetical protein
MAEIATVCSYRSRYSQRFSDMDAGEFASSTRAGLAGAA